MAKDSMVNASLACPPEIRARRLCLTRRRLAFVGVVTLVVGVLGACSSSKNNGPSTGTTTANTTATTYASPTDSNASAAGLLSGGSWDGSGVNNSQCVKNSGAASGSAYKIYLIGGFSGPESGLDDPVRTDMQSNFASFNDEGGICGHLIDLVTCDTQSNLNGGAACGQQVAAAKPIAVLDIDSQGSDLPYLEKADIADLNIGQSPAEVSSPVSFMISDITLSGGAGVPAAARFIGCKTWANITAATTPQDEQAYVKGEPIGDKLFGAKNVGNIFVPTTATDMSPYVLQASNSGADCIALAGFSVANEVSFLKAAANLPAGKKIITYVSLVGLPGVYDAVGPLIKQMQDQKRLIIVSGALPPTSKEPAAVRWVKDQTAHGGNYLDNVSGLMWASARLLIYVASSAYPGVTNTSVLQDLGKVHNYDPGLVPPVSFDQPVSNPYGARVFNAFEAPSADVNNTFPPLGPFINLLTGKTEKIGSGG